MSEITPPKVEYRQLGKCGLKVSVPILGAMGFGFNQWLPWIVEEEEAMKVLDAAWDHGINTIDTANMYSSGESERIIGKWIERNKIPRERIIIITKCWGLVKAGPVHLNLHLANDRDYVNQSGLSRASIFNSVDASLARLEVPYIDILEIHRFDASTPIEETMKALHESCSDWEKKNGWTKFVCMHVEYSLLYREDEREMNEYCEFSGIGLLPWAPLAAGLLARPPDITSLRTESLKGSPFHRPLSEADRNIILRVQELAQKKGLTMSQIALAWVATKVTSPVVGFNTVIKLREGIITGIVLTDDEKKYLEEPYVPKPVRGV